MSIRVDMTSADVDKQLELLKYYPEVLKKYFRPELRRATNALAAQIAPTIPVDTGRALAAFRSSVGGTGINMTGKVGWAASKDAPWYINVVEYGAKPHKIEAKEGGFLWFGGHVVRSVDHPGFAARGFMAAGFEAEQSSIEAGMAAASAAVVNEMAVK